MINVNQVGMNGKVQKKSKSFNSMLDIFCQDSPDHGERPEGACGLWDGAVGEAVRPIEQNAAQGAAGRAPAAAPEELLAHQGDPPPAS